MASKRGASATHFALMSSLGIVVTQPFIQIGLQSFDAFVKFLSEYNLLKFLQDRLVEPHRRCRWFAAI